MTMLNGGYIYRDIISRDGQGCRALDYYTARHAHFSREQWQQRFAAGQIQRGGEVLAPETLLRAGDRLEYRRAPWQEPPTPEHIAVLYEDEYTIVFDKPDGMPVLPGGEYLENSMVLRLRRTYGAALAPAHRLGRGTTGAILFTRDAASAAAFNALMRERHIEKRYLALVQGCAMPDSFSITTPIGRVPHARLGSIHDVTPEGKHASSHCAVLARFPATDTTLLQVDIHTGRTHQIRIHLASVGHPLVGDRFYPGPPPWTDAQRMLHNTALPGDPGYILHSWSIGFVHPYSGVHALITAPPRADLPGLLLPPAQQE